MAPGLTSTISGLGSSVVSVAHTAQGASVPSMPERKYSNRPVSFEVLMIQCKTKAELSQNLT